MERREKLVNRAAKLVMTQTAFMEGVHKMLHEGKGFVNMKEGQWKINFGSPQCSSLGPSRHQARNGRAPMIHTVQVPESWLDDVYAPGIAVVDGTLILSAERCDHDGGFEAWKVVNLYPLGRRVRSSLDNFVVRFGGLTAWAPGIKTAFAEIQNAIHAELGLAWERRF